MKKHKREKTECRTIRALSDVSRCMSGTSSSRFGINNDTKIMKCAHELVWCVFFSLRPNIPTTINTCKILYTS